MFFIDIELLMGAKLLILARVHITVAVHSYGFYRIPNLLYYIFIFFDFAKYLIYEYEIADI